jgi:hypothetical protein
MASEQDGIEAHALGVRLDDIGHGLIGQPLGNLAALPDRTEQRSGKDCRCLAPLPQGGDGTGHRAAHNCDGGTSTYLVRLALPDGDLEIGYALLVVLAIKRDQLGFDDR